ncbi:ABC transporter substrate-binding protein [Shewanella gaetbuli]|uniref:ABC transporter substrate-binding protein n=1 Tax=Shewanella gaetbuli TaxID=220752 RepID=A0A9X1ZMW6_9GAMM|nr:ABC transporter substrate-binding protein [Shewanella gaetbuli]
MKTFIAPTWLIFTSLLLSSSATSADLFLKAADNTSVDSIQLNAEDEKKITTLISLLQPTSLTSLEQQQELRWFAQQSKPFKGLTIRVVSESIKTHVYESEVLARLFYELTGIHVIHEITEEDDVIKKITAQIETGLNLYDAYINDSDLIGSHFRNGNITSITELVSFDDGKLTLPTLDINDFIGIKFTTGPDGIIYQLPDQQFANLYWYRSDWFEDVTFKRQFKSKYGYELGVPQNWQAYEDIAHFFSNDIKHINGVRVYGHMDYAATDPSLGWRISDAWLSMAGVGDVGLPNGLPVDEWGIRVEQCHPVGASVSRGGELNGPAAVYAIDKFVSWLDLAPQEARKLTFNQASKWPKTGQIAQQIFWYSAFVGEFIDPELAIVNEDGTPKWKVAPSPVGKYWQTGMKSGYQDTGAWTFINNTPKERQLAAWLYAQFLVSKSVSLHKTLVGYTPIRLSDIESEAMSQKAPYLGGLVEFYRSEARNVWTPTGTNVPDYRNMSGHWWHYIGKIVEGKLSTQQGLDAIADEFDRHLTELSQSSSNTKCVPKVNSPKPSDYWFKQPGAPKAALENSVKGKTLPYKEAILVWE